MYPSHPPPSRQGPLFLDKIQNKCRSGNVQARRSSTLEQTPIWLNVKTTYIQAAPLSLDKMSAVEGMCRCLLGTDLRPTDIWTRSWDCYIKRLRITLIFDLRSIDLYTQLIYNSEAKTIIDGQHKCRGNGVWVGEVSIFFNFASPEHAWHWQAGIQAGYPHDLDVK